MSKEDVDDSQTMSLLSQSDYMVDYRSTQKLRALQAETNNIGQTVSYSVAKPDSPMPPESANKQS